MKISSLSWPLSGSIPGEDFLPERFITMYAHDAMRVSQGRSSVRGTLRREARERMKVVCKTVAGALAEIEVEATDTLTEIKVRAEPLGIHLTLAIPDISF
eukprot:2416025-Rhodomonas_salina.3